MIRSCIKDLSCALRERVYSALDLIILYVDPVVSIGDFVLW